ncbi:PREDICTED: kelch-like protein 5 [Theobroma cacao]|uniref:Kelch-like protein 5 n=1 Tax=Theobroma cacao TaxID=3641 RepID=A0AB32V179_THECC|nr:PREDICTED: kelch-like protein 5 [Theobroma cacao]
MGSLPSPPQPTTPPPSPGFNPSRYRVIVAFCPKEAGPNANFFNCIQYYNPSNNTWSHVSLIPDLLENHVLKGFAMVSLGESIYIIGGTLWHKGRPQSSSDQSDEFVDVGVEVSPLVLRYNVRSDQWSKYAPLGIPRFDFAYAVGDNKIYVAGGKSNWDSARGISSAEVYDPARDEWTPLPSMSTLRYKCVGVTWQGKIYVVGGFAERGDSDLNMLTFSPQRSSAEVFDTRAGRWDLVAGMWQLDVPPNQIVSVDGKLFSSGDCLKPWKGHIEMYDGKLNMWDEVDGSCFQISTSAGTNDEHWPPMERLYLTMAPIGTQLYFLAGYRMAGESSRTLSTVYIFDTSATVDAWRSLAPTEEEGEKELCSHCCVVQLY